MAIIEVPSQLPPPQSMDDILYLVRNTQYHVNAITSLDVRLKSFAEKGADHTLSSMKTNLDDFLDLVADDQDLRHKIQGNQELFQEMVSVFHFGESTFQDFGKRCYDINCKPGINTKIFPTIWYACGPACDFKIARETEKWTMEQVSFYDDIIVKVEELKTGKEQDEIFSMKDYLQDEDAKAPTDAIDFWNDNWGDKCPECPFPEFIEALFITLASEVQRLDTQYGQNQSHKALTDCFVQSPEDNEVDYLEFMLFVQEKESLAHCLRHLVQSFFEKIKGSSSINLLDTIASETTTRNMGGFAPAPGGNMFYAQQPGFSQGFATAPPPYGYAQPYEPPPTQGGFASASGFAPPPTQNLNGGAYNFAATFPPPASAPVTKVVPQETHNEGAYNPTSTHETPQTDYLEEAERESKEKDAKKKKKKKKRRKRAGKVAKGTGKGAVKCLGFVAKVGVEVLLA